MSSVARWVWMGTLVAAGCLTSAAARLVPVTGRVVFVDNSPCGQATANGEVVIWLTPLDNSASNRDGVSARSTPEQFRLSQKRKRFSPHLLVVPVGAVVDFPNLDPFFHNVFSLFEGKRFDLGLYEAGTTRTVTFNRPGICYIFCNIHPEMSAVLVVLKTPYYGVSDSKGEITIPSVSPGRYRLEVWHERVLPEVLRGLAREITISNDSDFLGTIRLSRSGELTFSHKNKYGREYDVPTPSAPLYERP